MNQTPSICLANGVETPLVSLGTFPYKKKEVYHLIEMAWELGYRSFDTAWMYHNEISIGRVLSDLGIKRESVFLTSKLHIDSLYWPRFYYSLPLKGIKYKNIKKAYWQSCKRLGVDYLDLYLLHWPFPQYQQMWQELEKIYTEHDVRAIGVCSFLPKHIESLKNISSTIPLVNQIEMNPYNTRTETCLYCKQNKITVQAYSPLGGGVLTQGLLSDPTINGISIHHGVSPAQVILRWLAQREIISIPRTNKRAKLLQNISLFGFELSNSEMLSIDGLNRYSFLEGDSRRVGLDGYYVSS